MNKLLKRCLLETCEPFNDDVVNGIGAIELRKSEEFIDNIIKVAVKGSNGHLTYEGYRRLSPREEFESMFNSAGIMEYDLSKSTIYKVEYKFSSHGQPLPPKHLYLLYSEDGEDELPMVKLSGARYYVTPIITDTIISPGLDQVFAKLDNDKLIFRRLNRVIMKNGTISESHIIHSEIYKVTNKISSSTLSSVVVPSAVYILCKYGIKETFRRYGNADIKITMEDISDEDKSIYDVYASSKVKPKGVKTNIYKGHNAKILVPKFNNSEFTEIMVGALMYVLDVFSEDAEEMVNIINVNDAGMEIPFWKLLLGKLIFKDGLTNDEISGSMIDHFASIETYINNRIISKLKEINIKVNDFYDFIFVIVSNYNDFVLKAKEGKQSIYDKYLEVLYYIYFEFSHNMNRVSKDIVRRAKNSRNNKPNIQEVNKIIDNRIRTKSIFFVNSKGVNMALNGIEYCGDNKYFKITSTMDLQERGSTVYKAKQNKLPFNVRSISGTDVFAGSVLFLTKPLPSPLGKINPYVKIDLNTGRFNPTEEDKVLLDLLDKQLRGRNSNNDDIMKSIAENEAEIDGSPE